ncbi:MAG: hypothetical protein AAF192_02010 [Pseudomonadota bacterium]
MSWVMLDQEAGAAMRSQLLREVPSGHALHGRKDLEVIARRMDCDDVLVIDRGGADNGYVVHLTWSGEAGADEAFPWASPIAASELNIILGDASPSRT